MTQPLSPHKVIAARMRELRTGRGWSAQRLAEEMTKVGIPWDRSIVANLEGGRRRTVSVEEMFALAFILNVAPVHLMVPPVGKEDRSEYWIVPQSPIQGGQPFPDAVRAWIRGNLPLGTEPKRYFTEVPESEWEPPAAMREAWDGLRPRSSDPGGDDGER